ncbi:hypothetical protein KLUYMM157B_04515 [Kluyvera sp. M-M157-B]
MNTCDEAVKAKRKIYITLSLFILVYFFSWKATLDTYSFWLSEKNRSGRRGDRYCFRSKRFLCGID